jgi:hypothetical protein
MDQEAQGRSVPPGVTTNDRKGAVSDQGPRRVTGVSEVAAIATVYGSRSRWFGAPIVAVGR